jgi:glycosyltransferase involved in cell wall biosynthesis
MAGKGHRAGINILNVGTVSDHELKSLYEAAIAFVFPSYYEGFGLPVLESFYSRTIVVASKIPAFLEFKSDNIFFFDPDNMEELYIALKDAQGRRFIDNDFLDKFNNKNLIAKYDELLAKA